MSTLARRLPWFTAWLARPDATPRARENRREAPPPAVGDVFDSWPELEERRAAALRRMFPKLYTWYANRSEWKVAVDVHEYLAGATNVTDLENRIRAVEQHWRLGSFS